MDGFGVDQLKTAGGRFSGSAIYGQESDKMEFHEKCVREYMLYADSIYLCVGKTDVEVRVSCR